MAEHQHALHETLHGYLGTRARYFEVNFVHLCHQRLEVFVAAR